MRFSHQQDQALKAVHSWLRLGYPQVFRLFGYAGTGKTTLARYFAEHIDGEVQFAAFTGKAAQVLRSHGAKNARTIHSLIYHLRGEEEVENEQTGKKSISPSFCLNRQSDVARARLIVVDECSMVDEKLGSDLLSFGKPVLVLGDPGQLSPISGGGFFTQSPPDFLLTEIHRQAFDNPIIRLALEVKEGKMLSKGDFGSVKIISRHDLTTNCLVSADQLLVGTNRTRRLYNQTLRSLKGFSGAYPQSGDKLVCLRNNSQKELLNGSIWKVRTASSFDARKKIINLLIAPEEDDLQKNVIKIKLLADCFREDNVDVPWQIKKNYDDFDYGYALTVYKAQGSQWMNVVLFDESFAFPDSKWRWLYTAITRAMSTLIIVQ